MTTTFTKRYHTRDGLIAAVSNHRWLSGIGAAVPEILDADLAGLTLTLTRVCGHLPRNDDDLLCVAGELGHLHRVAHEHIERMDMLPLAPFGPQRWPKLSAQIAAANDSVLHLADMPKLQVLAAGASQAIYKDTNLRNVLIAGRRATWIDFDTLTLAPATYDLAKLIVSFAMTSGRKPPIEEMLAAYRAGMVADPRITVDILLVWAEAHHMLTRAYLGRHGYGYSWPAVRGREDETRVRATLRSAETQARS